MELLDSYRTEENPDEPETGDLRNGRTGYAHRHIGIDFSKKRQVLGISADELVVLCGHQKRLDKTGIARKDIALRDAHERTQA